MLLLSTLLSQEQNASAYPKPKSNHWFVSGHTGIAIRSNKLDKNFKQISEDFKHHPGFAYDISFGRTLGNHFETAVRWGAHTFFGQAPFPHIASLGYYNIYPETSGLSSLEYVTQNNSISLILRFLSGNNKRNHQGALQVRPFIEAGLGIHNFSTEVRYRSAPFEAHPSLVFRDRNGENKDGNFQISTGAGIKIGAQEKWNAIILIDAGWTSFSALHPVSHFSSNNRDNSKAVISRLTAGITIPLIRTRKTDNYLPFRW